MKKILIGLTLLASMTSFAETMEECNDRIDYAVTMRALLFSSGLETDVFIKNYNIDTSEGFIKGVKDLKVSNLIKSLEDSPFNDRPLGVSRAFSNFIYLRGKIMNNQQKELFDTLVLHGQNTSSTWETFVTDLRQKNILTPVTSDASCRKDQI